MEKPFAIPGFQLDLTEAQQTLAVELQENGFRFEMRNGSAKTIKFIKERKYGYLNSDVTKYGGVLGLSFPPAYVDASPHETIEETGKWFESKYPGSGNKIAFHSVPSKNAHYLIIIDVDLALQVCGISVKKKAKSLKREQEIGKYTQVKAECIKCFQKIGPAANFTKNGNVIKCMRKEAGVEWPSDWVDWVVTNAGEIVKGVEISK
jgi:hypothetical protein